MPTVLPLALTCNSFLWHGASYAFNQHGHPKVARHTPIRLADVMKGNQAAIVRQNTSKLSNRHENRAAGLTEEKDPVPGVDRVREAVWRADAVRASRPAQDATKPTFPDHVGSAMLTTDACALPLRVKWPAGRDRIYVHATRLKLSDLAIRLAHFIFPCLRWPSSPTCVRGLAKRPP
jgi:hypothetical protein